MAEGYTIYNEFSQSQTLHIKDFEQKSDFTEVLQCFYKPKGKTGLMSEVKLVFTDAICKTKKILTTSYNQKHAEIFFSKKAKKFIRKNRKNKKRKKITKISITILISNSPCNDCREDLEQFFIWSKVSVDFILRVGRLYCDKGSSAEAELQLSYWKNDLEMRQFRVSLSAINVCQEVRELKKEIQRTDKQKRSREDKDKKIKEQIENIQIGRSHVKKLIKGCLTLKSDFLKQHFIDVTDGQMMLATVIASGFTELNEHRPTKSRKNFKTKDKKDLISHLHLPESWVYIRKIFVLVCARVPSKDCQEIITSFLEEKRLEGVKNKLTLYIAKVPVNEERREFIEWIHSLEDSSISVCLQPFYCPLEYIQGHIVSYYETLRTDFQHLKSELESRISSPPDNESEMTSSSEHTPVAPDISTVPDQPPTSLTEPLLPQDTASNKPESSSKLIIMNYVPAHPDVLGM